MTLNEWLMKNPHVGSTALDGGAMMVHCRDRELWNLTDYLVSSAVGGPSVIMIRRP